MMNIMENVNNSPLTNEVEHINQNSVSKYSNRNILMYVTLLLLVASVAYLGNSNLQLSRKVATLEEQSKRSPVTPTPISIPTTPEPVSGKAYTFSNPTLKVTLPKQLDALGTLTEVEQHGETGSEVHISFPKYLYFAIDTPFKIAKLSNDFVSGGRETYFFDNLGYTKSGEVFYILPWLDSELTIQPPAHLANEIENKNGVKMLRIVGASTPVDRGGEMVNYPVTGTPGEGFVGVIINTRDKTYPSYTLMMKIEDDRTVEVFDQVIDSIEL